VTPTGATAVAGSSADAGVGSIDAIHGSSAHQSHSPTNTNGGWVGMTAASPPPIQISDSILHIHLEILNASMINGMSKIVLKSLPSICKLFSPIFQSLNTSVYSLFRTFITKVVQVSNAMCFFLLIMRPSL
jgi:hypothetical protein